MTKFIQSLVLSCLLVIVTFFASANIKPALAADCPGCDPKFDCVKDSITVTVDFPDETPTFKNKAPWIPNTTVTLVMNDLQALGELGYDATFSCPYGNFLERINNVLPKNGHKKGYWALCINDNLSPTGMDTTILRQGDQVLWKMCPSDGSHDSCQCTE